MVHIVVHIVEAAVLVYLIKYVDDLSAIILKMRDELKNATEEFEAIRVVSRTLKSVAATVEQRYTGRSRAVKTAQEEDTDSKV